MQRQREGRVPSSGPYWTEPLPIDPGELSPLIQCAIVQQAERSGFEGYVLQLYDVLEAEKPTGIFEIAFNPKTGMACAIYEAEAPVAKHSGPVVLSTEPLWFAASDPQNAADVFYELLVDRAVDA
ncbi:hypothetical protein M728_005244 (plasmid) [Ensifer sp. WSM1721]|uniref:hypothetical protein n=1 Tax=Ensifer sp. WSM1721 TaxID=1041159 RepID=UPI0012EB5CFD|nr:hypothetical protein [Ensifer sp. WSM1721]